MFQWKEKQLLIWHLNSSQRCIPQNNNILSKEAKAGFHGVLHFFNGNTSFFHKSANLRRKINWISSVEWNGSEFLSSAHLKRVFMEHFKLKEIFDEPSTPWIDFDSKNLYPSSLSLRDLCQPFTPDEVKEAVFSFKGDKSPRPHSSSMCFYQRFWNMVQYEIIALFQRLFCKNLDLSRLNYAFLTLIPKNELPESPSNFWPINLVHSYIKIISKVLANRVQPFLSVLIDEA